MEKIRYGIVKKVGIILLSIMILMVTNNSTYALSPSLTSTNAQRDALSWTWAYYERGYYEVNCLTYAITQGTGVTWSWPWGSRNPTIEEAKAYMRQLGFNVIYDTDTCASRSGWHVFAYAKSGLVTHFATSVGSNTVRAKWGHYEVFTHYSNNPYYSNSTYGSLAFNCMI